MQNTEDDHLLDDLMTRSKHPDSFTTQIVKKMQAATKLQRERADTADTTKTDLTSYISMYVIFLGVCGNCVRCSEEDWKRGSKALLDQSE